MSQGNVSKSSHVYRPHAYALVVELNQLTGIAAILTFPLDIEVVEAEEREAKLEQDSAETELDTNR